MALNGLICADVPLSNYSLTHCAKPKQLTVTFRVLHAYMTNVTVTCSLYK